MRNCVRDLYKELSYRNKSLNSSKKELQREFDNTTINKLYRCWYKENDYARKISRLHYESKFKWLTQKNKTEYEKDLPNHIDNIIMEDCVLPECFQSDPRIYGGISLTTDEVELLKLPPKFAVYKKSDELMLKSQFEKAITCLRWNYQPPKTNENQTRCLRDDIFDYMEKNIDFSFIKSNKLPFNKRVYMPPYVDETTEARISHARKEIEIIIDQHVKSDNNKGWNNLTKQQSIGLKRLRTRVKKKEIINYTTDKSGRMSTDSPANYIECMQVHLENTEKVSEKLYYDVENKINCHLNGWCNIIHANEQVRRSLQMTNNDIPPQYGLRKDHKVYDDELKGPPLRPVCGAVIASNYRLSYFLSKILRPYIKLAEEICDSTDDMLSRINETNKNEDLKNCIIGSFDVDALYPSIDVDFAIEKCLELILTSDITFKGIDFAEVGLYLSLTVMKEELEKENLLDFCPTRSIAGRPPTITSSGKHHNYEKRWNNWTTPLRKATTDTNRKLLIKAFEVALKLVMNNHIFTFNNELFKQIHGGAIGVSIAGDVANLFMVWWDRELKAHLTRAKIILLLYSRYVDDGNIVVKCQPDNPDEEYEIDRERKEKEIMEKIKIIANSIHDSISVKVDYPSNHANKRLPILDTEMWIKEIQVNETKKHQILYSYYEKEMSSKYLIHKKSALPNQAKINILANELIRVMKNTSTQVKEAEKQRNIQHFINKMQFSEYGKEERIHVYCKAKKIFKEKIANSEIFPHKDKFRKLNELAQKRQNPRKTWYNERKYKSTFYVDATPHSHLAKKCQRILDNCGIPIKVFEKTGDTIQNLLVKSDPLKNKKCHDEKCSVCTTNQNNINCKAREVVYENICEHYPTCKGTYIGETSNPIKERFREHLNDYRLRPEKSAMAKHAIEKHNGEKVTFQVKIRKTCSGDPLLRQCMESVLIRNLKPEMNSREEWGSTDNKRPKKTKENEQRQIETIPMHGENIATSDN